MARVKKDIADMHKSPFPVALRALMSEKPVTTQEKLAEITGKTRQTVSQYVNGVSEPGYDTLIKIADYFDVSIDYLLGRTKDRSMKPSVIDELGISESVATWFKSIKEESTDHYDLSGGINGILENHEFQLIIRDLRDYIESVKAEIVYHYLCADIGRSSYGADFKQRCIEEVHKIANSNIYGDTMSKCLIGENYVSNLDVCENEVVANILCNGIVAGFSEIYASRVSRNFTTFLKDLEDNATDMQTREMITFYQSKWGSTNGND